MEDKIEALLSKHDMEDIIVFLLNNVSADEIDIEYINSHVKEFELKGEM